MSPLFRAFLDFIAMTNGPLNSATIEEMNRLSNLRVLPEKSPKWNGGWRAGKFVDLASWQASYRASTNFPAPPNPGKPSSDILFALAQAETDLALLREAASRPECRFPVRYEQSFGALLPHLTHLKKLSLLPYMRALTLLGEGETDAAAMDTQLALRVSDFAATEPFLISHLVRIAQLEIALAPLWEGLAQKEWMEMHLTGFEHQLAKANLIADFHLAMRGERNVGAFAGLDMMRDHPKQYAMLASSEADQSILNSFRLMPAAFTDHSKVKIGELFGEYLKSVDVAARRFHPEIVVRVDQKLEQLKTQAWRKPYHILGSLLMPAFTKSTEKFARAQTTVDLARVAIALERHRLKHGAYPETLEAIDPALKPAGGLPRDVISGGPLRYARTADGRFHLYAVGWNSTDEGGSVAWKNAEKTHIDFTQGDWVWPQPAK
jgi:hypothetical protein